MNYEMAGPALVLAISAMGSSVGCFVAGAASHAVMSRVEEGHGKFILFSAAPSSQSIYGFLLMILMKNAIKAGTMSPEMGIVMGISAGLGLFFSSMYQGKVAATGIQATAKQPSLFGKCFAAVGIIESFSLFVFVFSILLM
jgi:V/A-type H+/Na+-transporting ATPase subunit K